MRDQQLVLPFGSLSMRKLFLSATAMLMVIFALFVASAPVAKAQAPPAATWSGNSITYNQHQYVSIGEARVGDSHKIPAGSQLFRYIEPTDSSASNPTKKAHLIYFAPGTDPTTATSASLVSYSLTGSDTYSNGSATTTITITPRSASDTEQQSSCDVPGIGWIVCPVSNFLARSMDWLFGVLSNFLTVQPLQSSPDNALYTGWSIMRNFANIMFVIGFLVIIYSQITNLGLSNYGLKKMLPRLIIAAILVNISYWICTIAVDISNITGYSLQDIFMGMRDNISGPNSRASEIGGWESVTSAVLGGLTLGTGGVIALVSIGSISGAIAMLLPVLVFVIVAALVAILIMAIRQALIVILVIIAPLAFVAFLLPNTEKYFEKWRGLFTTMLVLFPIFAVIFGGSQVAGTAIIQSADSIIMLILGMATQVAPLFVLPFLVKFSGGLIGQIAGIANNRSKGLVDRTRNFAKETADLKKSRNLKRPAPRTRFGRAASLRGLVQGADNRRLSREEEMKTNQTLAENRWRGTKKYESLDTAHREAERAKQILEHQHDTHWNNHARTDSQSRDLEFKLRVAADKASLAKAQLDGMHEDYKAGDLAGAVSELQKSAIITSQDLAISGMRQEAAKRKQVSDMAQALQDNSRQIHGENILTYAGGVEGSVGEESALSKAVASHRKQFGENVANNLELMKHFNLKTSDKFRLAMGKDIEAEKNGVKFTFKANNEQARDAAHEEILTKGSYREIEALIASTGVGLANHEYAGSIGRTVAEKGIPQKALYWGSKVLDDIGQGKISGQEGINKSIVHHIEEGKVKAEVLSSMDATALARMFKIAQQPSSYADFAKDPTQLAANSQALRAMANEILGSELLRRNASEKAQATMQTFVDGNPIVVEDLDINDLKVPPAT